MGKMSENEPLPKRATWMRTQGRTSVVGHRGAMGVCPENTLGAFEHAASLGAEWIELDVRLSKDGVPMVLHDASLERTTSGRGPIASQRATALEKLDAGTWFHERFGRERLPRLDAVLAWAKGRGIRVEIEMKGEPTTDERLPRAVLDCVARHEMKRDVLLISFDHHATKQAKAIEPTVRTGVLYIARPVDEIALARNARADVLLPHASFVSSESVRAAHAKGLAIATWASSDPAFLRTLVATGIDGITVDHPDALRKVLSRARPKQT